jgi:hypothetical protein
VRYLPTVPWESVAVRKVSETLVATLALALIVGFGTSDPAIAAAGRTPGTFAVSSSGASTYTIPIWAPPGPHGVQPHMALTYSSQQGSGYLGAAGH